MAPTSAVGPASSAWLCASCSCDLWQTRPPGLSLLIGKPGMMLMFTYLVGCGED